MAHDEVDAMAEGTRPPRRARWRVIVASGVLVVGAAVTAPVLFGPDGTAKDTPMMGAGHMMDPGQMMEPGRMMPGMMSGSGPMVAPPAHMDMMTSHMMDMKAMMGGTG
jgi:hypothetical protein